MRTTPPPTEASPTPKPRPPRPMFDRAGLARYLGVSLRTLARLNAGGFLPDPDLTVGRAPRWRQRTIAAWIDTRPKLPRRKGGAA